MGKYSDLLLTAEAEPPPQQGGKYSSQLLEPPPAATPRPQPGNRVQPPRFMETIRGKQDPAYEGTGTVFEQFRDDLASPTATAATLGASDAQMGDIIRQNLGDRYVRSERDANDYEVIVSRGPDGQEQKGYVNKPGLDTQDVWRGFYGSLPYVLTGGATAAAAKGAGIGVNALAQGMTAGATSVVGDVAQVPLGSEQGIELPKAVGTAAAGAVAVPLAAGASNLWRRFVTVPGLFDRATGRLTEKGAQVAQRNGIDPTTLEGEIAKEFAASYAKSGNAQAALMESQAKNGGIPVSRGQITKRPDLLDNEEKMRRGIYGPKAQMTMREFDARQTDAIKSRALGSDLPQEPRTGIGETLAPHRQPGVVPDDIRAVTLGSSARSGVQEAQQGAKAAENAAWEGTRDLTATKEALDALPDAINSRLGDVVVDDAITPMASRMGKELESFIAGDIPGASSGIIKGKATQSVDAMRRRLLALSESAANDTDSRAAGRVYDAYNDWIGDMAEKQLLAGNPEGALKLVAARGYTREVRALFSPKAKGGTQSPAAQRIAKVLDDAKADSGEGVINALFGAGTSATASGNGTAMALKNIKTLLERFAPETGRQAWDDIRLAYWSRLVLDRNGNMAGPQAIQGNIEKALQNQQSVLGILYGPQEMAQIRRFLGQIRNVTYKPPNASGSGYTMIAGLKEATINLLNSFGIGRHAQAAWEYSGIKNAYGAAKAASAVNPPSRPAPNALAPLMTGVGAADQRQR